MADYIVSARKYRPKNFELVVGQTALTTTLKNAILTGKIAQAYLFCGPRGVGKTTCARILAKTINCLNLHPDGEACDECESCRAFNEQRSLNIFELDAASNNSVEDIRKLVDQVRIPPQIGRYKVYIIDEVHMLSQQAFNAFLKTLEEPPKHAIFILATTEKQKIIPTILSRCQIYDFNRISVEDITEHLAKVAEKEGIQADSSALNIIATKADGGMRDALSIFDQVVSFSRGNITYQGVIENLNVLDYDYYFKLTAFMLKGDVPQCLLLLNDIMQKGFDPGNFISGMGSHLRDILVSKDESTLPLLEVGASIRERYKLAAQHCPQAFLYKAMRICNECSLSYRNSKNKRFHVECALIQLAQINDPQDSPDGREPEELTKLKPIRLSDQPIETPKKAQPDVPALPRKERPEPAAIQTLHTETAKAKPVIKDAGNLTISLNQPIEKERVPQAPPALSKESQAVIQKNQDFTQDQLEACWIEFTKSLPKERSAFSRNMQGQQVTKGADASVEIQVAEINLAEYKEMAPKIEAFLRDRLQNGSIRLLISVQKIVTSLNQLTLEEQFNELINKSKVLKEMRDEWGLEIS